MKKEPRLLRVGVLGCGPISQIAHFDACRKARNAELYAICDLAEDLLQKMAAIHEPRVTYSHLDQMLADPEFRDRPEVRDARLKELRKAMKAAPGMCCARYSPAAKGTT